MSSAPAAATTTAATTTTTNTLGDKWFKPFYQVCYLSFDDALSPATLNNFVSLGINEIQHE